MLVTFSQVYCDNEDQKSEQKDLKNLQCGQKCMSKTGAEEVVIIKGIRAAKEILSTLPRNKRQDGFRASQELARPYPSLAQGCKHKISFEKGPLGYPPCAGQLRNLFYQPQMTRPRGCCSHGPRQLGSCLRWW